MGAGATLLLLFASQAGSLPPDPGSYPDWAATTAYGDPLGPDWQLTSPSPA